MVAGAVMVLATIGRVQIWRSGPAIWMDAVRHSPDKPRPWVHLGAQFARQDAPELAAWAFSQAVDLSRDPRRQRVEGPMRIRHVALVNLAIYHATAGRYDEALRLTAEIQPRAEGRESPVTRMEQQWRDEQRHGGPSQAF